MSQAPNPKVCMVSLGCPKNLVDSELMLGSLSHEGFQWTLNPEEAEVLIVNTCSFIEGSKSESIDKLFEMAEYKKSGNCKVLVSTGCLSQRYGAAMKQDMPEVDLVVGTGEFDRLGSLLKDRFPEAEGLAPRTQVSDEPLFGTFRHILPDPDRPRILATPAHWAYLKVSEGCSHRCSFCIIPKIRGTLQSRPMDSIVREVEGLVASGVKEFNLIAQDLNEYGRDLAEGGTLAELLRRLDRVPGDFWLRPLYMYPLLFNDELIGVLRDAQHVVKYIDMPLQHISESVMRSMRRGSPGRYVRQLLGKLQKEIPEIVLRTTFIVGYPGETEADFQELYDFLQEVRFDRVGVFAYSQEENTEAATLPGQLPASLKEERRERLLELQQKISREKNEALVGKTFKVLVEGPSEESDWVLTGRYAGQAPEIDGITYLSELEAAPGEFVSAKIVEAHDYDLVAEPL